MLKWNKLFAPRVDEARLRTKMECATGFILEIDRQGNILYVNHHLGLYAGRNIREVLHSDQQEPALSAI